MAWSVRRSERASLGADRKSGSICCIGLGGVMGVPRKLVGKIVIKHVASERGVFGGLLV